MRSFLGASAILALLVCPVLDHGAGAQRVPQISRADLPAGLGIVRVRPKPGGALHFYAAPGVGERPADLAPVGTVRFAAAQPSVGIAEAPPWLVPERLKMDYELFLLRAVSLTPQWVEVIGNATTGETWWVARDDVGISTWPEFLLGVSSVEAFDPEANPVRARPLDGSPVLSSARASVRVLAVTDEWLRVDTSRLADRMPPEGWMRWRRGDRLLVTFDSLS